MPGESYRGVDRAARREDLINLISERADLSDPAGLLALCAAHDHCLDALICALVARAAWLGLTAVPPALPGAAHSKGWIHVPTCPLRPSSSRLPTGIHLRRHGATDKCPAGTARRADRRRESVLCRTSAWTSCSAVTRCGPTHDHDCWRSSGGAVRVPPACWVGRVACTRTSSSSSRCSLLSALSQRLPSCSGRTDG